jgi:hypothetical protein
MEPEDSLPCSQELATGAFPESFQLYDLFYADYVFQYVLLPARSYAFRFRTIVISVSFVLLLSTPALQSRFGTC